MSSTTSHATIEQLRVTFAQFGIPETIVSDNGSCFISEEFKAFLKDNGIVHICSVPYHPATNGLAERAVQMFKQGMKRMTSGSIQDRLARFLFSYRITPQSTTGSSAELLMGRKLRSRLDLVKPNLAKRVKEKQLSQKQTHDKHCKERFFSEGEEVFARDYRRNAVSKWLPGRVVDQTGPISFQVQLENGEVKRYHQDQMRRNPVSTDTPEESGQETSSTDSTEPEPNLLEKEPVMGESESHSVDSQASPVVESQRYPSRNRQPPIRYM